MGKEQDCVLFKIFVGETCKRNEINLKLNLNETPLVLKLFYNDFPNACEISANQRACYCAM